MPYVEVISAHQPTLRQVNQVATFLNDCACEPGLPRNPNYCEPTKGLPESWPETFIPKIYNNLYHHLLNLQYQASYNPAASYGVAVLNQAGQQLLKAIDGKRNLVALSQNLGWPLDEVQEGLRLLKEAELIYLEEREPEVVLAQTKSVSVWLHVTNQCNLRCSYCFVSKTPQKLSLELGKQALDEIIESALRQGQEEVILKFAGGEALSVFPTVRRLATYARELGIRQGLTVKPVILTNGTLLTAPMARLLKEDGFSVALSLDGLGEYNDLTRPAIDGRSSFEKIERGMKLLQAEKITFSISVVVSRHNLEHLPSLTSYLLEHKLFFNFNFFRENELAEQELHLDNAELTYWLKEVYAVIGRILPAHSLMNSILDRVQFNQPHLQACGAGTNYIVIKHTGEVVGCHMHLQKRGVGRVGQGHNLLQLVQKGHFVKPEERSVLNKIGCYNCQWRYVCAGGCPILALKAKGGRSPFCETYQALIPQVIQLEAARLLKYAYQLD